MTFLILEKWREEESLATGDLQSAWLSLAPAPRGLTTRAAASPHHSRSRNLDLRAWRWCFGTTATFFPFSFFVIGVYLVKQDAGGQNRVAGYFFNGGVWGKWG